ncbi:MAG TPA: cytochrome c biogenesis protein ResB [Dehalococcoidia bacterium]
MAEASFGRRARLRWSDVDPLRLLWRGLVSVRFALGLIGFLALASLAGVLIPQLPVEMRGNPAAEAGWLEFQRGKFGFLTDPMDALGLFQVFRSLWFVSGLGLLVASVCVCTANRLPPIWRNVFSPQTRVPDEYLQGGASVSVAATNVDALSRELARRRYRVTTATEGNATYVFADRYPWAQFATFISHLALILFLAGGFVTVVTAREQQVFIAEGEPALPVFAVDDADHMQVAVEDAVGRFDASGFPLDFRTSLAVYKDGREVAQGVTTVSDPLHYGGYTFHQSFYFPDGAHLKVRNLTTGRTVYDEVLALTSSAATPQIVVRDAAGDVILEDAIIPTDFIADAAAGTTVAIPGTGRQFWIGARPGAEDADWQLIVFETTQAEGARELLGPGQTVRLGDLSLSFSGITAVPSLVVKSIPGLDGEGVAELSRGPAGDLLTVGPIAGRALALSPGESAVLGDYEYTFEGRREFSGLTVRRDPGSMFIWVATGLFLLGLALTFYTPRRRLWGKIAMGQAAFRGLGGRQLAVEREIREVAAKASAVE